MEKVDKIELRSVNDLLPYALNSKVHTDTQVNQIASSIREFGFNSPILIAKDGTIIAGHGRLLAAKKLEMEEVPTITLEHLNEMREKGYRLADNRIAENAEWDEDLLKLDLTELEKLSDFDLEESLGFSSEDLDKYLGDLDSQEQSGKASDNEEKEINNAPYNTTADPSKIKLILGDSLDKLKELDADSIDSLVTDPPAGISFMGKKWDHFGDKKPQGGKSIANKEFTDNKREEPCGYFKERGSKIDVSGREGFIEAITAIMIECKRVLKPGAHGLIWAIPRTSGWTSNALENAGFEIRDTICHLYGQGFPKSLNIKNKMLTDIEMQLKEQGVKNIEWK